MSRDIPWADLHLKVQENLIHFLDVELDLVETLCDRAKTHPERRTEILGKIKQAIDTVRHFAGRIDDHCTREIILDRADDLEYRAQKIAQ